MTDSGICIELTGPQVNHVIRESSVDDGISGLLRALKDRGALASKSRIIAESPRLSQSLLLGLLVFLCFPADGGSLAISDVARQLTMSPSTTHRYITTLLAVGLLEQDASTRRYRVPAAG